MGIQRDELARINTRHGLRFTAGQTNETDDLVVITDRFGLFLNDRPVTKLVASRDMLRELGARYVISEGLVRCVNKVITTRDRIMVCSDTGCDLNGHCGRPAHPGGRVSFPECPRSDRISGYPRKK